MSLLLRLLLLPCLGEGLLKRPIPALLLCIFLQWRRQGRPGRCTTQLLRSRRLQRSTGAP